MISNFETNDQYHIITTYIHTYIHKGRKGLGERGSV